MTEREKLIEILGTKIHPREGVDPAAVSQIFCLIMMSCRSCGVGSALTPDVRRRPSLRTEGTYSAETTQNRRAMGELPTGMIFAAAAGERRTSHEICTHQHPPKVV